MERMKPFFNYLHKFVDLSEEEFNHYIKPIITFRTFKKRELITKAGEVENYFNFVVKGLARKYYVKDKNEYNIQISYEGHILHVQESFHSRTPSFYSIETLEPTTLLSI